MRSFLKLVGIGLFIAVATIMSRPSTLLAFPSFSLAPGSPSAGALPPGSILNPFLGAPTGGGPQPPPVIGFGNAALGLPAAGNVQDFSYGDDQVLFIGFGSGPLFFRFSVAPAAIGGPWLPPAPPHNVLTQGAAAGMENSASADIFSTVGAIMPPPFGGLGCGLGGNTQLYDGDGTNVIGPPVPGLGGLVDPPGPPADDQIDGFENLGPTAVDYQTALAPPLSGPDGKPDAPIFFTVDPATAGALGVSPADVLVTNPFSATGWSVYAPAGALGLVPGDDIDALMVADSATAGAGPGSIVAPARTYSPATAMDFVAFSLAPGSPSLGGGPLPAVCVPGVKTAGDVWGISPSVGPAPFPLASAESLGLCSVRVGACGGVNDNLVSLDIQWAGDGDADGAPDAIEGGPCGAAVGPADSDGDGLPDSIEMTLSTNLGGGLCSGMPKPGIPDSDGDGMFDSWEMAYWLPGCLATNASTPDPAADTDGDAVPNIIEYGQFTSPCNADSDFDGHSDLQSTSHQGPSNTAVTSDNCPNIPNPGQINSDGNFIDTSPPKAVDDLTWPNSDQNGDACDTDDDNDGLSDATETGGPPCASASAATNPLVRDTDGDRALDGAECALGFDPASAASTPPLFPAGDTDHDGLTDAFEGTIGTNPLMPDTDGDRIIDGVEYTGYNSSPLSTNSDGDACGDGKEIGSVNDDGKVNSTDQTFVAGAFGVAPGPPYYVFYDINKDGKVNSTDKTIQTFVYGSFCP